jgi:hypothetical protein
VGDDGRRTISTGENNIPFAMQDAVAAVQKLCILLGLVCLMDVGREQWLKRTGERKPWAVRTTSLVCLLLLALLTFVQVVHVHPAATDADHCPICVAMHSATPVTVLAVAIVFERISAPVPVPVIHSVVRPWHCTLFNRPPPTEA